MKFSRLTIASICGMLALASLNTGCGSVSNLKAKYSQKKQQKALEKAAELAAEEKNKPAISQAIGEVSYVDEESGFILIRQLVGRKIAPNTPLFSRGRASVTAKLMSNPAAKGSFVVADIISGQPQKGDAVMTDVEGANAKLAAAPPVMPIPAGQTAPAGTAGEASGTNTPETGASRLPPRLDPILPPLEPLLPPSGVPENVPLPQ